MDGQGYAQLLASIKGFEIRLIDSETVLQGEGLDDQQVTVSMAPRLVSHGTGKMTIDVTFTVDSKGAANDEPGFNLVFTFRILYSIDADYEPADDLIKELMHRNVPINIWPYAREFVSSMTARMGLLPLFLEPLQIRA